MTQPLNRRFLMQDRLPLPAADIANDAIVTEKILDGAVTSAKIANGTIVDADVNTSAAIAKTKIAGTAVTLADTGTVTSTMIANGTIVEADLADGAVTSAKIADGTIVAGDLASNSVTTVKITDANVTTAKLADSAVTTEKIADANVTAAKLAANSVASANIIDGTITTGDIADSAITSAKIADGTIVAGDIADGAITSAKILDGTIVNADINASAAIAYTKITQQPITNLSDVQISTPTGGQVIKYDGSLTKWINGPAAGGVTASATAPTLSSAAAGDAWFDTNDGTLYVCYIDQDSTKQWVQVQANSALEGTILARLSSLEGQAIAYGTQSPNYLINGGFDVWQRGTSFTSSSYTADRWYSPISAGVTVSQETSDLPTGFQYGIKFVTTGAVQYAQWNQPIETANVIPLRGQTVTVSGYIKISGGYVGNWISQAQYSTSSDAYSSQTTLVSGSNKNVATAATTSWTRFTNTFVVPTNAVGLRIENIPDSVQPSGVTVRMTGLQLEVGSIATSFRRNQVNIQAELASCQRYYRRFTSGGDGIYFAGTWYEANVLWVPIIWPTPMRSKPVVSTGGGPNINVYGGGGGTVLSAITEYSGGVPTASGGVYKFTTTTGGNIIGRSGFVGLANAGTWIDFSAEL